MASSVGESKCRITAVEKMEGGFSKALRMIKEDGTEVVAKIPCPNAGPVSLTTASEVAVMKYGSYHYFSSVVHPRVNMDSLQYSEEPYIDSRPRGIRVEL